MSRVGSAFALGLGLLSSCAPVPRAAAPNRGASTAPYCVLRVRLPPDDVDLEATRNALLVQRTAELRGLPVKRPIPFELRDRKGMVSVVERIVAAEADAGDIRGQEALLRALGVVPVDFDFVKTVLTFLQADLAGLYDHREKRMYVDSHLSGDEAEGTKAHELVHALQDQHFDLGALMKGARGDRGSVLQALAEGDATSVMIDYVAPEGQTAVDLPDSYVGAMMDASLGDARTAGVPTVVKRSLLAPYKDGLRFVNQLRRRGGWAAVDAAWRALPVSTEQVLHLEKFDAHELPIAVNGAIAGEGEPTYKDVLGEQGLRVLLEEWVSPGVAARAASGWGGDDVRVVKTPNGLRARVLLVMDDDGAAARVFLAVANGVIRESEVAPTGATERNAVAERAVHQRVVCRTRPGRGPMAAARAGRAISIVADVQGRQGCEDLLEAAPRLALLGSQTTAKASGR